VNTSCLVTIEKINELIESKVGPQRFRIWFKNSTRLIIEDDYVKVGVPNLFVGGWLETHFSTDINNAVNDVTQKEMKVIYTIDPELFGHQRRRQLDSQAESVEKCTNPSVHQRKRKRVYNSSATNLRLKLDNFIVGPSNELAWSASQTVIKEPGRHFNPLFIHGNCGLGKTHLLQGLCNEVLKRRPDTRLIYVSGEEFTNQFILGLKMNKLDAFRKRFREADLLVIDDIHFIANKKATQEEFLHTFNAIDTASKQIVLASDAHPKMIGMLTESLVSRFVSGMVVKVDTPDIKTRLKILSQRVKELKKDIPQPVLQYIAENLQANIRELEGALLKVVAFASLTKEPVTLVMARQALDDHITRTDPIVHLSDIESTVATFFGITPADIHSSKKNRTVSLARGVAMFLARKHTSLSYPEIGRFMGNKNHATVILACRKVQKYITNEEEAVRWETPSGRTDMQIESMIGQLETAIGR
jgi:chromosomal replication initiator protein